jgi:hypothetical protein
LFTIGLQADVKIGKWQVRSRLGNFGWFGLLHRRLNLWDRRQHDARRLGYRWLWFRIGIPDGCRSRVRSHSDGFYLCLSALWAPLAEGGFDGLQLPGERLAIPRISTILESSWLGNLDSNQD